MEKNTTEQNIERSIDYLIENPNEITAEDLKINHAFLNDFYRVIIKCDVHSSDAPPLAVDTKMAITETGFNLERFSLLTEKIDDLLVKFSHIFNEITSENLAKLAETSHQVALLQEERDELMLPVYKKLRAVGYKHYPDLTK